jgi:hypothetical protein
VADLPANFGELRNGEVRLRSPRLWSRRHRSASEEARSRGGPLKGKGGKRGPPQRCDTNNPTTAKRAPHLPGDHNRRYQVAISRSPLSPRPDGPEPLAG